MTRKTTKYFMTQKASSTFINREAWRQWLFENHAGFSEFWIIFYKKHTGKPTIIYREALEEALCFGWIDGIVKRIDDECYMQRFTPRRSRSNWSETNIRLALKLVLEGRMHESGLVFSQHWVPVSGKKAITSSEFPIPMALTEAFNENPAAGLNFEMFPASCRKEYLHWILSAKKEETRLKRIAEAVSLLEKGKRLGLK